MRPLKPVLAHVFLMLLGCSLACPMAAQTISPQASSAPNTSSYWSDPLNWKQQFVPDSQPFWDNSKFWTTNFGPAYRDTAEKVSQFLACSSSSRSVLNQASRLCLARSLPTAGPLIASAWSTTSPITCWPQQF